MPYGITDQNWGRLTPAQQTHAQQRIQNAENGKGAYGSVANAKAANARDFGFSMFDSPAATPFEQSAGITPYPQTMSAAPSGEAAPAADVPTDPGTGTAPDVAPPPELATSPEWLAYLNALGLEQSNYTADNQRQGALVGSETDRQAGLIGPQYALGRQQVAASQEGRGVFRSGQTQTRLADNRRQEGIAQSNLQADKASQLSSLQSALANKVIDINARKAAQELTLRGQGYV